LKKKKWIVIVIAILLVTNLLSFYGGSTMVLTLPNGQIVSRKDVGVFQKLFQIKNQLYKYYAGGTISDSVLADGAVKGMTSSLNDPYTVFMNKKDYASFNSMMQGNDNEYCGVGVVVEPQDDKVLILSVFDGSPAKKAGILPKDIILKVDGKAVSATNLDAAVALVKGKEGTAVTLTLYRASKGSFDVKLNRQKIVSPNITGEVLGNNIGYIKMGMFDANTGKDFDNKLTELKSKGTKGLILDLRQNGGGYLDQCIEVTSNFVKKGNTIVYTIDKNNLKEVSKSIGGIANGMPLVVLVDGNTASASEVFSGAIKDYKAGTLIGTKTFGKGIVQSTLVDRSDDTALKVTISKYYSPLGINIHKKGITPDIVVECPEDLKYKDYRDQDPQFQKALEVIKDKISKVK
jgi:carboxyl-terminal processing protease